MLIDASIHGPEAARALRRWRWGVGVGLVPSLITSFVVWNLWYGSAELDLASSAGSIFLVVSGLALVASALVFLGVRDYVGAMQGSFGALPRVLLWAAALDVALDGFWFVSQVIEFVTSSPILRAGPWTGVLRFVAVVFAPLATVASVMVFGRVTSTLGSRLSPLLAGGVVLSIAARLVLQGVRELGLGASVEGHWAQTGLHILADVLFLVLSTRHASVLAAHRPLGPRDEMLGRRGSFGDLALGAAEWEAPGRALARHRHAVVAQILLSLGSVLVVLATRESPEAVGEVVSGAALLGLVVSLVLVVSVVRYASSLPSLAASGPAKLAASLFVLNALVGLVTTVLVVRAFSSGRLGLLFDLQDQLPVLEALGTISGLGGLLAILYSFDALGDELGERALPVRTTGLKIALTFVVVCALCAKLGAGVLGPLVAVFGIVFAIGALFTLFSYLRVVGDVSALLLARAGVI